MVDSFDRWGSLSVRKLDDDVIAQVVQLDCAFFVASVVEQSLLQTEIDEQLRSWRKFGSQAYTDYDSTHLRSDFDHLVAQYCCEVEEVVQVACTDASV